MGQKTRLKKGSYKRSDKNKGYDPSKSYFKQKGRILSDYPEWADRLVNLYTRNGETVAVLARNNGVDLDVDDDWIATVVVRRFVKKLDGYMFLLKTWYTEGGVAKVKLKGADIHPRWICPSYIFIDASMRKHKSTPSGAYVRIDIREDKENYDKASDIVSSSNNLDELVSILSSDSDLFHIDVRDRNTVEVIKEVEKIVEVIKAPVATGLEGYLYQFIGDNVMIRKCDDLPVGINALSTDSVPVFRKMISDGALEVRDGVTVVSSDAFGELSEYIIATQ